ncbi:unnamed protein product [Enterobius vermicularis]|uniref:Fibronectin type-III domain-containing protein n=1 Tax=Enterobius vermicularis TaxID=51028 RepID=A0A0N4VL50_ENTVE|nr:unnamed protein product [Enterobius vermicularis]
MRILKLFWLTAGLYLLLFTKRVYAISGFKYASNVPVAIDNEPLGDENTAPDPPRNVRCVASSHSAILYWEHPSSRNRIKVRGYSIEWGIGAPNAKADVQGTETSFSIIELRPNTTYTFSIFAFNDFGDSETVEITATTTQVEHREEDLIYLQAPKIISIKMLTSTSIEVHWDDPNVDYSFEFNAETVQRKKLYLIKYGIDKTRIYNEISSITPAATITNLKPGNVYGISVKVVVDKVSSLWSPIETIEIPSRGNAACHQKFLS